MPIFGYKNYTLFLNLSNFFISRHFIITRWITKILNEIKPKYSLSKYISQFFLFQDPSLWCKKVPVFFKNGKVHNKQLLWLSLFQASNMVYFEEIWWILNMIRPYNTIFVKKIIKAQVNRHFLISLSKNPENGK